jgi:putative endonuclease
MKILILKASHIEDRRAESSKDKPSMVIEEICEECKSTFHYVVATGDASNFTPVCKPCGGKIKTWYVYLARCADNSLYCGITTDLKKREDDHNSPRGGAKYTRSRQPVGIVYYEKHVGKSEATKREHVVKKMTKAAKEKLVKG